ncbi:MAG: hypothetical protein D3922_07945 [Candidatus Electrothrix sp. AR1]|nr:hypothetical protein [Candidatus Electrothrix sp. AR1]
MVFNEFDEKVNGINKELRASFPDQPWAWKEEWAIGRITDTLEAGWRWGILFFSLFIHVAAWWLAIWTEHVITLTPLLLLTAAFLVKWIQGIRRHAKYGNSVLEMDTVPGLLGETFSGTLEIAAFPLLREGVKIIVHCESRYHGSGRGDSSRRTPLWYHSYFVVENETIVRNDRRIIPISFKLPKHNEIKDTSLETKFIINKRSVCWTLEVVSEFPGIDFSTFFEFPVFHVKDPALVLHKKDRPTNPY